MDKVLRYLNRLGDVVQFVHTTEYLKAAALNFKREVLESEEVYGISMPFATDVSLIGVKGVYLPTRYEDNNKGLKTQKLFIFVLTEGAFFEIDIPGQGPYCFFYDGKQKGFAPKASFDKKDFEARSKKNIDESSLKRAERKAAEDLRRQSASVRPFIEELLVESPVSKIVDDYWKKEDGGTHNPFTVLSPAQSKTAPRAAMATGDNSKDKKTAKATAAKAEPAVTMAG